MCDRKNVTGIVIVPNGTIVFLIYYEHLNLRCKVALQIIKCHNKMAPFYFWRVKMFDRKNVTGVVIVPNGAILSHFLLADSVENLILIVFLSAMSLRRTSKDQNYSSLHWDKITPKTWQKHQFLVNFY